MQAAVGNAANRRISMLARFSFQPLCAAAYACARAFPRCCRFHAPLDRSFSTAAAFTGAHRPHWHLSMRFLSDGSTSSTNCHASELRKGDVVRFKDKLLSVLKATISAQGRGRSNLIIEWRDIRSGSKITETIIPSTKMHKIFLSRVEFEYLYSEGGNLLFMNQDSFEQVAVPSHLLDDALPFVSEGMRLHMCVDNDNNVVTVEVPDKVTCTVQVTEPVLSGQAAARNSKPAVLTNGVTVSVPMFVEAGHRIIVNVHERTYSGRAEAE